MKLYQFNVLNFRQIYFLFGFLVAVFIVGCVSVQQEEPNQSFMVSADQGGHHSTPNNIDAITHLDQHWQSGDIIYAANGYTDHMGMIDDSIYAVGNSPDILDSDRNGAIRRHNDIDKWVDQGEWAIIQGYYVSMEQSASVVRGMTNNAFNIGGVFNAQSEITLVPKLYKRNSPPNTHSSQLVRHAYKYLYDIDLDADGGWWSWPKDIRQNPNVKAIPGASFARS